MEVPEQYIKKFDKYETLINKQVHPHTNTVDAHVFTHCNVTFKADSDLEKFLSEEHSFDEYNTVSLLDRILANVYYMMTLYSYWRITINWLKNYSTV